MTDWTRVRDLDTGHELTVAASAVPHGNFEELKDAPAVDVSGDPLPPVHATPKPAPKSGASVEPTTTTTGRTAEKEAKPNG